MEATTAALVFLPVALFYAVFLIVALRADNDRKDAEIRRLKAIADPPHYSYTEAALLRAKGYRAR